VSAVSLWVNRPAGTRAAGWLRTVDHKEIGVLYIGMGIAFFALGGIEALLLRAQLATPQEHLLDPETYDQIFTVHGVTMILLAVVPLIVGFANYLVPLMIGAADVAYPRLNALSFWLSLLGGIVLYFSFVAGGAPDAGWFSYTPLAERPFAPGAGVDYYILGLAVNGAGTIIGAINLTVTILLMRAPGLAISRLPLSPSCSTKSRPFTRRNCIAIQKRLSIYGNVASAILSSLRNSASAMLPVAICAVI